MYDPTCTRTRTAIPAPNTLSARYVALRLGKRLNAERYASARDGRPRYVAAYDRPSASSAEPLQVDVHTTNDHLHTVASPVIDLRPVWADVVDPRIRHTGWFADEYGESTCRGFVLALPHGRGWLAGHAWLEGVAGMGTVERERYGCPLSAASAADSAAENAADAEREYQARWQQEQDAIETLTEARAEWIDARRAWREQTTDYGRDMLARQCALLRRELYDAVDALRSLDASAE